MSRTKKDILDTEAMLHRLGELLAQHAIGEATMQSRADAKSLRRISMTLHRWHELECGDSNDYYSFVLVRGAKDGNGGFVHNDDGAPFIERHENRSTRGDDKLRAYWTPIPDGEAGAKKRLAKILKRYPALSAYVQGDPRGCALYILKPGDVRKGHDVSSCYTNGLAVYQ